MNSTDTEFMKTGFLFLSLALLTLGCDSQIANIVGHRPSSSSNPAQHSSSNPWAVKISPGSNSISGTALTGRVSISPTQRYVEGSQVKARVSFYQNRPE